MMRIESRSNSTYKSIAALRRPGRSREAGLVFLEGVRLCMDALASGVQVEYALVADAAVEQMQEILTDLPDTARTIGLPDSLFNKLCDTRHPQGIALVCRSPQLDMPSVLPKAGGLYLIAEAISDPGNLGTMIRIADAFAFEAVLLTAGTVYPFNDKVMRAAMGSCFHINLLSMDGMSDCLDWLSCGGVNPSLIAADPAGPDRLPERIDRPTALVIGNEANGISLAARSACTHLVGIDMPGQAESLNAASASAILCHDLMRIRSGFDSNIS